MPGSPDDRRGVNYSPLVDVDPPLVDNIMALLAARNIAAYSEPFIGDVGPYRDVQPPRQPTTRIYVASSDVPAARRILDDTLPELRATFLADAAVRADRIDMEKSRVDQEFAALVADLDPGEPPAEELDLVDLIIDGVPDDDPDEHFEPPIPPPLRPPHEPVSRFAWAALIGGPILVLVAYLLTLPRWIAGIGALAFLAGFITLIWRRHEEREGWDDGAVV